MTLLADPGDKTGFDRKLGRGKRQRLLGNLDTDAIEFEQDTARLDARDPELRRALARAHAHFKWLLRHRHIREHPDPDPARTLHVTGQRAAGGFYLPRRDALRLERFQPILAERERCRTGRNAVDTALMRLAELRPDRL